MRSIKLKEFWNQADTDLVSRNGGITKIGKMIYWKVIDASVKFNIAKREQYLMKDHSSQKKINESVGKDPMREFIRRNQHSGSRDGDKFHWKKNND